MIEDNGIKLVVCLGNPGQRYAGTRHNAGWQTADRILEKALRWEKAESQSESGRLFKVWTSGNREFLLLKPMTYMNSSGQAVVEVTGASGISPLDVLVVCDCMDLPIGRLRLRRNGSSGGQRGVESIIACLQTVDFPRLRIGVGRPEPGVDVVDHVLSDWVSAEPELVGQILATAADCVLKCVDDGFEVACRLAGECSADKINAKIKGETEIGEV